MRLRVAAIDNLCNRCEESYPELVQSFGAAGVAAIREAIGFTLDFLRPAFEFGYLKPFIDYLYWLTETLKFSGVPADHVLTMLDWLSEFFEAQMQYEESGSIILALMSAKSKLITQNAASSGIDKHMPSAWPEYIEFEQALLKCDMTRAKVTFDNYIAAGKTLLEIELHLVQPALYQVGLDWQQNKVTVAQEHLATSTAITLIALEFSKVTLGTSNGKRVICACVEGNEHAVGIRIVADAFELNGWDVLFLGKDVSSKKLIEHTRKFGPHLICLSITLPNQLLAARAAIRDLHQAFHEKVPAIMLGGLAANTHTPMVEVVGADRTAPDASKAIEISTQFFGM